MESTEHIELLRMLQGDEKELDEVLELDTDTRKQEDEPKPQPSEIIPKPVSSMEASASTFSLYKTKLSVPTRDQLKGRLEATATKADMLALLKQYMPPGEGQRFAVPVSEQYNLLWNVLQIYASYTDVSGRALEMTRAAKVLLGEIAANMLSHVGFRDVSYFMLEQWDPWLATLDPYYYDVDRSAYPGVAKRACQAASYGIDIFLGILRKERMQGGRPSLSFLYSFLELGSAQERNHPSINIDDRKAFLRDMVNLGVGVLQTAKTDVTSATTSKMIRDALRDVAAGRPPRVALTSSFPKNQRIYQALYRRIRVRQGEGEHHPFSDQYFQGLCKEFPSLGNWDKSTFRNLRNSLEKKRGWWVEWDHIIKGTQECLVPDEQPLGMEILYCAGGFFPWESNRHYKIVDWVGAGYLGLSVEGQSVWVASLGDTACRTTYWSGILAWKKVQGAVDSILKVAYEVAPPSYLIPIKGVVQAKGWENYLASVEKARRILEHSCAALRAPLDLSAVLDYDAVLVKSEQERKEMFGLLNPVLSSEGEMFLRLPGTLSKDQIVLFMKILRAEQCDEPCIFPSTFLLRSGMGWDQVKKALGRNKES